MKKILLLITITIFSLSCGKTEVKNNSKITKLQKKEKKEEILGKTFFNNLTGVSIVIPKEWNVTSSDQMEFLKNLGNEMMSKDENGKKIYESVDKLNTLFNFMAFKYPLGTPGKLNPNVTLIGENIKMYPGVKTSADYIENIKFALKNSAIKYNFDETLEDFEVNGYIFKKLIGNATFNGINIMQQYATTIIDHYAITFVGTYYDDNSKKDIEKILKTIKIKR